MRCDKKSASYCGAAQSGELYNKRWSGSGGCRSLVRYPDYMVIVELCRMRRCGVVFSVFEVQDLDV